MGVATGDYDNDGNEDLFVTGYAQNHHYHNNGNCTCHGCNGDRGRCRSRLVHQRCFRRPKLMMGCRTWL
jgi:hypothetical protein